MTINQELVSAVRAIAHGGTNGPTGLELVAMALAPVAPAIAEAGSEVAGALRDVASAIHALAGAWRRNESDSTVLGEESS